MSCTPPTRSALPLLAALSVASACATAAEQDIPGAGSARSVRSDATREPEATPVPAAALPDDAPSAQLPAAPTRASQQAASSRASHTFYSLPALQDAVSGAVEGSAVYAADGLPLWAPPHGMEVRSISCAAAGGFWAHVREESGMRSSLYQVNARGEEARVERVFDARGHSVNLMAGYEVTRCGARVLFATPSVWGERGELLQPSRVRSLDGDFEWSAPEGDVHALACEADGAVVAHVVGQAPVRTWLYHIAQDGTLASVDELFDSSAGHVNGMAGADVVRCGAQLLYTLPALLDETSTPLHPSTVRSADGALAWDAADGKEVRAVSCRAGGGFVAHLIGQAPVRSWIVEIGADGSQTAASLAFDSSAGHVNAASGFDVATCD